MTTEIDLLVGREVGRYRLLRELGSGGAGVVYLGLDAVDNVTLRAVKLLLPHGTFSATDAVAFRERFMREARAATELTHEHILPVLASGHDGDLAYMVLPYVTGGTLEERIAAGPLSLSQISSYLEQIASALDFAHGHGVVHRDIKPNNILLDGDHVYLADFGIARIFQSDDGPFTSAPLTLTVTGQVLGTPHYMAPEQLNTHDVGPAADIYALGVVLYQMVTGHLPFEAATPLGVIMKHVQELPTPPHSRRPDLPEAAEAAILRALAKQPEDRFASAGALARAFRAGLQGRWADEPVASTARPETPIAPTLLALPLSGAAASAPTFGPSLGQTAEPLHVTLPAAVVVPLTTRTFVAAAMLLAIIMGLVGVLSFARATSQPSGNAGSPRAAASGVNLPVAAGPLLYRTDAPGACDQQGGAWAHSPRAVESCSGGHLVLKDYGCTCPIGVVALTSIPNKSLPSSYVAQTTLDPTGSASWAKFGFKFDQQSLADAGHGRGGYAFLIDQRGWWQFNRYSDDGTRHMLAQEQLSAPVGGVTTLTLVVRDNTYSFYVNGHLVSTQSDSTYDTGFFAIAVEPAAVVTYRDLAMYASA